MKTAYISTTKARNNIYDILKKCRDENQQYIFMLKGEPIGRLVNEKYFQRLLLQNFIAKNIDIKEAKRKIENGEFVTHEEIIKDFFG